MKAALKKMMRILDVILNRIFLSKIFIKKLFMEVVEQGLEGCDSVLEVGAGAGSYLRSIGRPLKITGIDIHEESLLQGVRRKMFDEVVVGNALELDRLFPPGSFDAVTAFDFIEHLEKNEGCEFLDNCEKVARKAVIVFTPNGFLEQPPAKDNPFQEHRSGWTFKEMAERGYVVRGVNGVKWLSGMYNMPRIKPVSLGNAMRNASAILLRLLKLERYSACILCIKRVAGSPRL